MDRDPQLQVTTGQRVGGGSASNRRNGSQRLCAQGGHSIGHSPEDAKPRGDAHWRTPFISNGNPLYASRGIDYRVHRRFTVGLGAFGLHAMGDQMVISQMTATAPATTTMPGMPPGHMRPAWVLVQWAPARCRQARCRLMGMAPRPSCQARMCRITASRPRPRGHSLPESPSASMWRARGLTTVWQQPTASAETDNRMAAVWRITLGPQSFRGPRDCSHHIERRPFLLWLGYSLLL